MTHERGSSGAFRSERRVVLLLPALTIAVAAATWWFAAQGPIPAFARVYVPCLSDSQVALRVETFVLEGSAIQPKSVPFQLLLTDAQGHQATLFGRTSASGQAVVNAQDEGLEPIELQFAVSAGGLIVAEGRVQPRCEAPRSLGGPIALKPLQISQPGVEFWVASRRGALAVPFDDILMLGCRPLGEDCVRASVSIGLVGATTEGAQTLETSTNDQGQLELPITAAAHVVMTHIEVRSSRGAFRVNASLPVVPGAIDVRLLSGRLRVTSAIPRDWAHVDLLDERGRVLSSLSLPLIETATGSGSAETPLPVGVQPHWAVASSEFDMKSPGRIGWPLTTSAEPQYAVVPTEPQILDGLPALRAAQQSARKRLRKYLILEFLAGAFLQLAVAWHWLSGEHRRNAGHRWQSKTSKWPAIVLPPIGLLAFAVGVATAL